MAMFMTSKMIKFGFGGGGTKKPKTLMYAGKSETFLFDQNSLIIFFFFYVF